MVVISDTGDTVVYMNELCQKLMMYVTKTFHDDEMLKKHKKKIEANPTTMLDIKMFYVFQN